MLKLCLDCIAGPRTENEEQHNTQLNGYTHRAPPWPTSQYNNEIMFILPKQLSAGDQINVAGNMTNDPKSLTVSFLTGQSNMAPDYQNIACQLQAIFPPNSSNQGGEMSLKVIENGQETGEKYDLPPPTELFTDLNFNFGFTIRVNRYQGGHMLHIYVGPSYLEEIKLVHNIEDIRFLSLSGDITKIDKLDFQFA